MYLEHISSPSDVKKLSLDELKALCGEIRGALVEKLSRHGGHCGPNFGFVEATVALHYVFESPKDKIVFDVSHQTYPHKMLTGRAEAFLDPTHYDDVSGYSNPHESEHDHFTVGHTSTSVSLACGLAKGRDLKGEGGNVIAVIGDGSLSGGEALEALDYAAELGGSFIILVNDNDMSIAENHGGIYGNLRLLRETGGRADCNLFRAMGLDYRFVADGNDLPSVIEALQAVRDIDHPVVVHLVTEKGKGFAPAEAHKEEWHYCAPFDRETFQPLMSTEGESWESLTADFMMKKMQADSSVCMITSGTPTVLGFTEDKRRLAGRQFIDVGIAEENAVARVRHRGSRRQAGLRRILHLYPAHLRPAFAGSMHQQQPGDHHRCVGVDLRHERRDPPRYLRHPDDVQHSESRLPRTDEQGRISCHA